MNSSRPRGVRFLLEGPIDVAFKNVPTAIAACRNADIQDVWLLSSSDISEIEGVDRVFSRVPLAQVAPIYASCDVLVKLSYVEGMFGPPLEMFHCGGTTVVYAVTGHDDYIVHGVNGLVAAADDRVTLDKYLRDLSNSPELLKLLKIGARTTARDWDDLQTSTTNFLNHILSLPPAGPGMRERLKKTSQRVWAILTTKYTLEISSIERTSEDETRPAILTELRVRRELLRPDQALEMHTIRHAQVFDYDWYLARYPDVRRANMDPLEHYVLWGAQEGRDPSPTFSTLKYLRTHVQARKSGVNPLAHSVGLELLAKPTMRHRIRRSLGSLLKRDLRSPGQK